MPMIELGLAFARPVLELAFPQHCGGCECASEAWLCAACEARMAEIAAEARCQVCGAPVAEADAPCPRCEGRRGRLIATTARLGTHRDVLRELIHRMKYSRQWGLARRLALLLREQATVETLLKECDLVVPVPLHWRRRIARGYNQSELLARELARGSDLQVLDALKRTRDTPHQTAIRSLTQRARNVKDAFEVRGGAAGLAGKRIVLVDDVFTTGATLRTAARVLKKAGVGRIDAIVLAVADPKNRDFQTISA